MNIIIITVYIATIRTRWWTIMLQGATLYYYNYT